MGWWRDVGEKVSKLIFLFLFLYFFQLSLFIKNICFFFSICEFSLILFHLILVSLKLRKTDKEYDHNNVFVSWKNNRWTLEYWFCYIFASGAPDPTFSFRHFFKLPVLPHGTRGRWCFNVSYENIFIWFFFIFIYLLLNLFLESWWFL